MTEKYTLTITVTEPNGDKIQLETALDHSIIGIKNVPLNEILPHKLSNKNLVNQRNKSVKLTCIREDLFVDITRCFANALSNREGWHRERKT